MSSKTMNQIKPFFAVLKKELLRFSRVFGQTVGTPLITSFLYLSIFGVSIGRQIQTQEGMSYLEFIIPGLIMMGGINHSFLNSLGSLLLSKLHGNIEDLKIAPIKITSILWGYTIASLIRGLIVSLFIAIVSSFFLWFSQGKILWPSHFFYTIFFLLLACLTFSFLGFSCGIWARSFEFLNAMSQFILAPLIYLGGVFFSLDHLNPIWQKIALLNPLFYYISSMRYAISNKFEISWIVSIEVMFTFLIFSYCLALWSAHRASFRKL